MSTLLFVFTLALPATGNPARAEIQASAQFDVARASAVPTSQFGRLDWSRMGGGGALSATLFLGRPLVDDDAPLSAQAFLQRKTTLSLGAGGFGLSIDWSDAGTSVIHRDWKQGSVSASVGGYVRWLYLAAGAGYRNATWQDQIEFPGAPPGPSTTEAELPLSAALGGRIADTLVYFGWGVSVLSRGSSSTPSQVPFWGGAFAGAQTIIARRVELQALVNVLDGGASATVRAELFIGRRLGLYLGVSGGAAQVTNASPPTSQSFAGGDAGVALWVTRQVKLDLGYEPSWNRPSNSPDTIDHLIALAVSARL